MSRFAREFDEWRHRWETDPNVMFKDIGARVGCTGVAVSVYARKQGWTPAEGVAAQRRSIQVNRPKQPIRPTKIIDPNYIRPPDHMAWTSVFGIGSPISTQRCGPNQDPSETAA